MLFEARRRVTTASLSEADYRIGRDPTSHLVVESPHVARHHAVIHARGRRHALHDLGSGNGVLVGGQPIGEQPRLLEDGDVIELAEDVVLLYEAGPVAGNSPWLFTAAAALLLLAAAIGLYLASTHA